MLDLLDCNGKKGIGSMTLEGVTAQMAALGEKSSRTKQLYDWVHVKLAEKFDNTSSLSRELRQRLRENHSLTCLKLVDERISQADGTRKYLFDLEDDHMIESAWMQYHHSNSTCVSSQVSCRAGCCFCASILDDPERNLRPSETLGRMYRIQSITEGHVSSVVVTGLGEPMNNYDDVIHFLCLVSHDKGLNISQRSLTISIYRTVPGIRRFTQEGLAVTLALSPHAPNDEVRKTLMPIAGTYKLYDVLEACHYYYEKTGRRLTSEYGLVRGVNDNLDETRALTKLIRDQHDHVSLIPVNPIRERDYVQSGQKAVQGFKNLLEKNGIDVTIRREMGRDIGGVYGQLRRSYKEASAVPQCTEGEE